MPCVTGPSKGCRRNSNDVTIPKFAPAPRMPQKSSGFSSSLARTTRPSAVTSSTATQAVDRQTELALQPAHPAAEREAGHARVGDDADRADEPVRLRRVVELGEQRAAAHAGDAPLGIDVGAAHPREVDHDAVVAGREAGDAVAAAPNGDDEVLLTGEAESRDDVVGARRPHDQRRPTVDHAVPDRARRVVALVVGAHDLARETVRQLVQVPLS